MIDTLMLEYQAKLNSRLDILISESGQRYDSVVKAARYSLLNSGKRIRPIILLEFYRLCGGSDDCAYHFAAALEMIHTYSLIHDDLPCMDDDDMRRGKPSCHKQFGEATALLAGDTLLTEAFAVAGKTVGLPFERVVRAMGVLASCAGVSGMIGGQVIDLENENKTVSTEALLEMYRLKTGALIRAAALIGCILAGVEEEYEPIAERYADNLGLAFQVIDDILDYEGDAETLGKPIGSDEKNGKNTVVAVLGLEKAKELAADLTDKALNALQEFPGDITALSQLTEKLLNRKY